MELLGSNIQKIPEIETLKKLLIFQKMDIFSPSTKKLLIFQETETLKRFLILSREKAFLLFSETEIPKKNSLCFTKRNFSYVSGRYIQNPGIT